MAYEAGNYLYTTRVHALLKAVFSASHNYGIVHVLQECHNVNTIIDFPTDYTKFSEVLNAFVDGRNSSSV